MLPSREVLIRIVESLQGEKAALDAQLRAVATDRDGLAAECARLRAANLEKDQQLALLLAGRSSIVLEQPASGLGLDGTPDSFGESLHEST